MRVIWNDDKRALRTHECLTALAIYRAYKKAGDDYLAEVDVAKSGYVVRKDIRNTTPSTVFEEFTDLYQNLVQDIDALYSDKDGMNQKMIQGEWNPIEELMKDDRMKNAIGVFLQRKNMILHRMTEDEAFDAARESLHAAIDDMKGFIGAFMADAAQTLVTAIARNNMKDGKDIGALRPKVLGLDWSGLVVRIDVDDETIMLNDAKEEEEDSANAETFDPSYG
mgnify:FL=1|jgi:hypothetical protein|tara:strand:- start:9975 stop:10643 length:669 start_codon:yes stop_codon:yes gene_type:complete